MPSDCEKKRPDGTAPESMTGDSCDRVEDEHDLEKMRDMLFQAGKLAELGTQMASLVHEMNQPLVAIKAFAQMIKGATAEETTRRRATLIEEQADVLARLVDRIRVHARKGSSGIASDLGAGAQRSIELMDHLLRKTGVDLDLDLDTDALRVPLDEVHVQQILVNLISNAVDALEQESDKRVSISVRRSSDRVRLIVADSGCGVPQEIAGQILDPFFTTKGPEKGTGLGLSISREIIRSCGGSLSIKSGDSIQELKESRFRTVVEVDLPVADDEPIPVDSEGERE